MKKIILIAISITMSVVLLAQTPKHAVSANQANWNQYTKKWDFNAAHPVNMTFVLYKDKIVVDDKANSTYIILSSRPDEDNSTYNSASWNCSDERGRRCIFSMVFYKEGKTVYMVMYDSVLFTYTIESNYIEN